MRSSKLEEWAVEGASVENIERLCKYLKIPPGYTPQKRFLINWLIWEGYVVDKFKKNWSMY